MTTISVGNGNVTVFTAGYHTLFVASHAAAGLGGIGAVFDMLLLASILRHWRQLARGGSFNMVLAIGLLVLLSMLDGALLAAVSELWVATAWAEFGGAAAATATATATALLDAPLVANALASLGYALLTGLFAANLLLALERHHQITARVSLPPSLRRAVFASAALFVAANIACFGISVSLQP
ncbi:hypothetical protein HK100_011726 [Physocladia obscura]|uniref:Uncharacterized protein n=1 Tax=Physocladia obscura TaxID=109957 RepID=A0AAD5XDZ0_9FUNG|nr:hypothetical protein HK100_011726 [Physocladia obscura]